MRQGPLADDKPAYVLGEVARKTDQLTGQGDQHPDFSVAVIKTGVRKLLFERRAPPIDGFGYTIEQ